MNKDWLIEKVEVSLFDPKTNELIVKITVPVMEDENGKYAFLGFIDGKDQKIYLQDKK
jgi:hypothetical protein